MIDAYLNLNKYNVINDYLDYKKKDLLYHYKKSILEATNKPEAVTDIPDTRAKFFQVPIDENGIEIADDVSELYPVSLEEEKNQINSKLKNLQYLRKSRDIFEYCRTTCKVPDTRMRNLVVLPKDNQMCLTDCLNVRHELYLTERPANEEKKRKLVWLA